MLYLRYLSYSLPSPIILVDAVGVEPTVPGAGDLQSPGVTSFPTHPLTHSFECVY